MAKALKPGDMRLKANRDWREFMMRAVHIPSMQRAKGEFHVEPIAAPILFDRHTDAQLLLFLAIDLYKRGLATESPGTIVAHLRERAAKAELNAGDRWWATLSPEDRITFADHMTGKKRKTPDGECDA